MATSSLKPDNSPPKPSAIEGVPLSMRMECQPPIFDKVEYAITTNTLLSAEDLTEVAAYSGLSIRYAREVLKSRFKEAEARIAQDPQDVFYYFAGVIQRYSPADASDVCKHLFQCNPDLWFTFGERDFPFIDLDFLLNNGVTFMFSGFGEVPTVCNGRDVLSCLVTLTDFAKKYPVLQEKLDAYLLRQKEHVPLESGVGMVGLPTF